METIIEQCMALSLEQRDNLAWKLLQSVHDERKADLKRELDACRDRGKMLLYAAKETWGVDNATPHKKEENVWARSFVLWQMLKEGYSIYIATDMIGKDRVTGYYLRDKMRFMLEHPNTYPTAYDKWADFQKKINTEYHV